MLDLDWFSENFDSQGNPISSGATKKAQHAKKSDDLAALISASSEGDLKKVISICELQPHLKNQMHNGFSALHAAIQRDRMNVVGYLLSLQDTKLNLETRGLHLTPFLLACSEGKLEIAEVLLKHLHDLKLVETEVCRRTPDDHNALHLACFKGHLTIVKFLLGAKQAPPPLFDINCPTYDGQTALMFAVAANHVEVVKYLCSLEEIDILSSTESGQNCLHKAAYLGYLELVAFFTEKNLIPVTGTTPEGMNCLHFAAMGGRKEVVRYILLSGKLDPQITTSTGQNALHKACAGGHHALVFLLLGVYAQQQQQQAGVVGRPARGEAEEGRGRSSNGSGAAYTDAADTQGLTPLMLAAGAGAHVACDLLLGAGADPGRLDGPAEEEASEDAAVKASKSGFARLAARLTRRLAVAARVERMLPAVNL